MSNRLDSQLAFRVPEQIVKALNLLAEKLSQPGASLSRADAARVALYRGLEQEVAEVRSKKTEEKGSSSR